MLKIKNYLNKTIWYTLVAVTLSCFVFLFAIGYVYKNAEDVGYEQLHMQTKQIKDDINLQIMSDRENLMTMANFAAQLYEEGQSYDLLFESFKPIGLIDNIGILEPDNTFITRRGRISFDNSFSFREEVEKGAYTSGRVKDLTNAGRETIRSAVPIVSDGDVVGILYGTINLNALNKRYSDNVSALDAQLYVFEKESGNLLIDTFRDELGNISRLEERKYKRGFSYNQIVEEENGYSAFHSTAVGEDLYVHYSTLGISDWKIMLARPESNVFENAHHLANVLLGAFLMMLLVVAVYFMGILNAEKRKNAITDCASKTRKLLLDMNQQSGNLAQALENITSMTKSRSTIFVDTDGSDYNYIVPSFAKYLLTGDDRSYFISKLFCHAADISDSRGTMVGIVSVKADAELNKKDPEFFEFMKKHEIHEACIATILGKDSLNSILGVVNPKRCADARVLLEEVAVCFSIAIYNKKYLNRTELAAATDSLTGLSNRVSYNRDIARFDAEKPESFACLYVDVNELHLRNNRFGHAAGDEMLIYVANTLKEIFFDQSVYRMGGDEFLVFTRGLTQDEVKNRVERFKEMLNEMDYHVAIGMTYRAQNTNTNELVRDAEIRMYEAKAQYYQNKELKSVSRETDEDFQYIHTGIVEVDAMISVMKEHYNGIYRVSLKTDSAKRILMPSYLGYNETEEYFSRIFTKYIDETVNPDFRRILMSFLNYDALRRQLLEGNVPGVTYKKINGETVALSVYSLGGTDSIDDTLWVFEKI